MDFFKKILLVVLSALLISGCSSAFSGNSRYTTEQEDIFLKVNNYDGLINLYRDQLKKNDTPGTRLKLANYYYLAGDYTSSLYYSQLLSNEENPEVYDLQAKNQIALGDYSKAIQLTDRMLHINPHSAEAWNLRGIALALSGKMREGQLAIEKSRDLFMVDYIAVNNMATLAAMDKRYQDAVGLLLPQYLRGKKQPQLVHNLVLVLVKAGDRRYARTVIENENLSSNPDELMDALAAVNPYDRENI